jgi:hypothetical protein
VKILKYFPSIYNLLSDLKWIRRVSGSSNGMAGEKYRCRYSKEALTVFHEKRTSLQSPFRKVTSDCIISATKKQNFNKNDKD